MGEQLIEAVEKAIDQLVADFQRNPDRSWNERDMHWSLFYYLKHEEVIEEAYVTQLIRAEFPTLNKFDGARGHYDLVVLDYESYNSPDVQAMKAETSWDEFLPKIKITIAIEVKLWQVRFQHERADKIINWDIRKLTENPNVLNAYFLNFVQLGFTKQEMKSWYSMLRGSLMTQKRSWLDLKILCVPSDKTIQPDPSQNWLSL